jgi:hypothetical protein
MSPQQHNTIKIQNQPQNQNQNQHFFIMDGHGFHVTIKTLEQVVEIMLDMVTLPTHISHAL